MGQGLEMTSPFHSFWRRPLGTIPPPLSPHLALPPVSMIWSAGGDCVDAADSATHLPAHTVRISWMDIRSVRPVYQPWSSLSFKY